MPELGKQLQSSGESDGQFVFSDLDEMDSIIAELEALRVDIATDQNKFALAIGDAVAPAYDDMSRLQADAYRASLRMARLHNASMLSYLSRHLARLEAARNAYVNADEDAEDRLLDVERARR